jgi:hypothetical protein
MTRTQGLIGMAVVAVIIGGSVGIAVSAARTHGKANAVKITDAFSHGCAGIEQGSFEWRWSEVPLATNCDTQ